MFLAEVMGCVVSSKKDVLLTGQRLVMLRPMLVGADGGCHFVKGKNTLVAVDRLGVGEGELVMFCQGSSARMAEGMKTLPIDAAVVGIVDTVRCGDGQLTVRDLEDSTKG